MRSLTWISLQSLGRRFHPNWNPEFPGLRSIGRLEVGPGVGAGDQAWSVVQDWHSFFFRDVKKIIDVPRKSKDDTLPMLSSKDETLP